MCDKKFMSMIITFQANNYLNVTMDHCIKEHRVIGNNFSLCTKIWPMPSKLFYNMLLHIDIMSLKNKTFGNLTFIMYDRTYVECPLSKNA